MSKTIKNVVVGVIVTGVLVTGSVFMIGEAVQATRPPEPKKVTICHRTSSTTNPYEKKEVSADSADGDTGNDNGKGDHSEHTGAVATSEAVAQALKDAKQKWGDIIPPHDNYAGLNWSTAGQAVYNNDCNYVPPIDDDKCDPTNKPSGDCVEPPKEQTNTPTVNPQPQAQPFVEPEHGKGE